MLNNTLVLAWQFYRENKTAPYQKSLRWVQAILMIFIVTLTQTSHSIQDYLADNLNNLLGADLVISQYQALTAQQLQTLKTLSNQIVQTKSVKTTIAHKDKWQRVSIKGVADNYPLQGQLKAADSLSGQPINTPNGPRAGEIWVDFRLSASLQLSIGELMTLGNQQLSVSKILLHEPDRLMEGHNVEMRALLNLSNLDQIISSEDNINFRYLISASSIQLEQIITWQKQHLPAAQIYHKQGAHPLALFWKRTENFIGLASIILFFMAAIATQQLTQIHNKKEQYFSAVALSAGATHTSIFSISILKWVFGIVYLLPVVLMVSTLAHWLIIYWLSDTLMNIEWQLSFVGMKAFAAMSLLFAVFQLPIWIGLKNSSVAQLIQDKSPTLNHFVSLSCVLFTLIAITLTYSDNGLLTAMVLSSMAACVAFILLLSWFFMSVGERLTNNHSGLLPFALFMMKQRMLSKTTQILGVGLCAFLLLFTLMLLKDVGTSMTSYKRQHDGNLLISQANEKQMQDVLTWSTQRNIKIKQNKPFVYAQLIKINQKSPEQYTQNPSQSLSSFSRPIRMHWSEKLPANNELLLGKWWVENDSNWQQVSIEQEVMTDLGLQINDKLSFMIGSEEIDFTVVASHQYKSGSGSITFWVQAPPSITHHVNEPRYSMASLELQEQDFLQLGELWRKHPSLRMVSLQEMTQRFDSMLSLVTQVIAGFSVLITMLATIVIMSSAQTIEANEKKKNSVIMSFGFDRATCIKLNVIEWITTGMIAAGGAIAGTWVAGWLIYQSQFSMTYQPDILWLSLTLLIILSFVLLVGTVASKSSLNSSIRELMAE